MCGQCLAECKDICEVIPGYKLVRATKDDCILTVMVAGDYGLVNLDTDQCPEFVFKYKPTPCHTGWELPESDHNYDEMEMVMSVGRNVLDYAQNLHELACLVETCIKTGLWNSETEGYFENWLANRIGVAIKEYEETGKTKPIERYQGEGNDQN